MPIKQEPVAPLLADRLTAELMREHGPMMTGEALRRALGYPSMDAFRQAVFRRTVPIPVFSIPHRRGKFALVADIARWIAEQRLGLGNGKNRLPDTG